MSERNNWDEIMEKNQQQQKASNRIDKGVKIVKGANRILNIAVTAIIVIVLIILFIITR